MKSEIMPIPMDAEIGALIRQTAEESGLKQADVMRQGLRHGVPAFLQRLRKVEVERPAACLGYLDDYPKSAPAKGYKNALHAKLQAKYARKNR